MLSRTSSGIVLVRVAAEETVVALEAATERPAVVGAGRGRCFRRREVPLADRVGVVAVLQQDFREEAVLERDVAVAARIADGAFGDAGHAVGVVIAPRDHARARRRAQRRRVHVVVAQPVGRQRVEVRRLDRAAVAAEMPEAGVVEHDEQHVRRACFARLGAGHAGCETSKVRPMTPGNAVPGSYSLRDMMWLPSFRDQRPRTMQRKPR